MRVFLISINHHIRRALGKRKSVNDFQRQRAYSFHENKLINEKLIDPPKADKLIKQLDRSWDIYTTQLYPHKWTDDYGEGWPLAKRHAAVQLPLNMLTVSYLAHEHAHGVVECYRHYSHSGKKVNDYGHGPLWAGVFAYNYAKVSELPLLDMVDKLRYHGLCVIGEESIEYFRHIFLE